MKIILTIFSTILLLICLISCNKKVEEDNYDPYFELERTPYIQYISRIDYNPETNINYDLGALVITGEYKEVVTKRDVPYFNIDEIVDAMNLFTASCGRLFT